MRLTELKKDFDIKTRRSYAIYKEKQVNTYNDILTKLGQLEDIEEKLGIDFTILWKAITQGVYACYSVDKEPAYIEPDSVYILKDRLSVGFYPEDWKNDKLMHGKECRWGCPYNRYGITWALTKEELE